MSKPKSSSTAVQSGAGPADIGAPIPKPARKPRTPKSTGPTNRIVTDVAGDETLVLNCLTEEQAIEAVAGKYTTRIIGISDAVKMAQKQGARVIDLFDVPATTTE